MDRNIALLTALRALSMSLSARRAWIEIDEILRPLFDKYWSLSARRAWIEIHVFYHCDQNSQSLSARRAWIEMQN